MFFLSLFQTCLLQPIKKSKKKLQPNERGRKGTHLSSFKKRVDTTLAMKERKLALREELELQQKELRLAEERQKEDMAERRRLYERILL